MRSESFTTIQSVRVIARRTSAIADLRVRVAPLWRKAHRTCRRHRPGRHRQEARRAEAPPRLRPRQPEPHRQTARHVAPWCTRVSRTQPTAAFPAPWNFALPPTLPRRRATALLRRSRLRCPTLRDGRGRLCEPRSELVAEVDAPVERTLQRCVLFGRSKATNGGEARVENGGGHWARRSLGVTPSRRDEHPVGSAPPDVPQEANSPNVAGHGSHGRGARPASAGCGSRFRIRWR